MSQLLSVLSAVLLVFVLSQGARAHDLWVEREGNLQRLYFGHERSAHEGAQHLEYRPETVRQAACHGADGKQVRAEIGEAYPVSLKGDCAASLFLVSSGYWSKTPYGTRNLPRNEAGQVFESWLSVETVKRIDRWGDGLAEALGEGLELVPLGNPLSLKAGEKLRLRAMRQGRPAADVTVAYFGKPRGVTGADGLINIRLNQPGLQLIQASQEALLPGDVRADKVIRGATLQFEIK